GGKSENVTDIVRCVAFEKDSLQAGAVIEGVLTDIGKTARDRDVGQAPAFSERPFLAISDAAGDRNAGQGGAVLERPKTAAGNGAGDCDVGQAVAGRERIDPDAGDAAGDRIASSFAGGVLDEPGLVLVEQNSIRTAEGWVSWIHCERKHARAAQER